MRLSALKTDTLQQRGKHPFDFEEFRSHLPVLDWVQHVQVSRKQQEIFELGSGDAINPENKFMAPAPNFEFTEVLHGPAWGKPLGARVNLELNIYNLLLQIGDANA